MLMMMGMDASVDVKAGRVNAAKLQWTTSIKNVVISVMIVIRSRMTGDVAYQVSSSLNLEIYKENQTTFSARWMEWQSVVRQQNKPM